MNRLAEDNLKFSHIRRDLQARLNQVIIGLHGAIESRQHGIIHYEAYLVFINDNQKYSFHKISLERWNFNIGNNSQFVQRILQHRNISNFFDLMRMIRNFFSHKVFQNHPNNKTLMVQIPNKQKLRIITHDYQFLSTFLFQREDELAAFSVYQVLMIRVKRCNELIKIHIAENMGHQYVEFPHQGYLTGLINSLQQGIIHGYTRNAQTNMTNLCQTTLCDGYYIRKKLITPIANKLKNQSLSLFENDLGFTRFDLRCKKLKGVKIGKNSILDALIHLLFLFQQYLKIQVTQFLLKRV